MHQASPTRAGQKKKHRCRQASHGLVTNQTNRRLDGVKTGPAEIPLVHWTGNIMQALLSNRVFIDSGMLAAGMLAGSPAAEGVLGLIGSGASFWHARPAGDRPPAGRNRILLAGLAF